MAINYSVAFFRSTSLLSLLLLGLLPFSAFSQTRPTNPRSTSPNTETKKEETKGTGLFNRPLGIPDTFDTQYFFMDNPFLIMEQQDTLLGGIFSQPDPAYQEDFVYANLGNLGSPLTPLVYESTSKEGLKAGFHSFDQYYFEKTDLRFYRLKSAYTNATYNQGRTQDDQNLKIEFATEFGKSLSFTLKHDRINHLGVYQQQLARNYALNTGFWYHHPDGKYQNFLTYTTNSTVHLENGGVNLLGLTEGNVLREETVPVLLSADTTRYQMRTVGFRQYYNLRNPLPNKIKSDDNLEDFPMLDKDSIGNTYLDALSRTDSDSIMLADSLAEVDEQNQNLELQKDTTILVLDSTNIQLDTLGIPIDSLQLPLDSLGLPSDSLQIASDSTKVKKRKRKKKEVFIDPNRLFPKRRQITLGHDLNYFTGFYKYADQNPTEEFYEHFYVFNQGLQYKLNHSGLENQFFISTTSIGSSNNGKTQTPRDFFKAGIEHSFNNYSQISDTVNINNLSIFGNINYQPFKNITVSAQASFHFAGYNAGDYSISGKAKFSLDKIGSLNAFALSQAYEPTIFQSKFFISGFEIWNNDFQKTIETKIGGELHIDKTNTTVGVNFHLLDNFIYLDTLGITQQESELFTIPQLIIKQNFKVGILHLDNIVVLQQSKEEVLALPQIYSKHELYLESLIFKNKLLLRVGAEGIFHTNYKARKYQPILGQFYNSNEELKYYPQIDPFISFKRSRFRFYVRMQNAASFIIPDQFGFRTPNYPIPYRVFRFGISWILLN